MLMGQHLDDTTSTEASSDGKLGQVLNHNSAEKPRAMLRQAQHERKILNVINPLPVRPEPVEG